MGINTDNFEQYFLDYSEGNLSPEMEKELADFLLAHPEFKALLEEFDPAPIPSEPVVFRAKDRLKKNISPTVHIHDGNFGEWMISSVEGLLNTDQEAELQEFIRHNPNLRKEMEAFGRAKLVADISVNFPGKEGLRRKAPLILLSRTGWTSAAVAALFILLLGIRYFINPHDEEPLPDSGQVATNQTIPAGGADLNPAENQEQAPSDDPGALKNKISTPVQPSRTISPDESIRTEAFRMEHTLAANPLMVEKEFLASIEPKMISIPPDRSKSKDPSLFSKIADNLFASAENNIRKKIRLEEIGGKRFSFWGLLDSGIRGYNTITDRDIELYVRRDEDGQVSSYTLVENNQLILTRDLNKN